MPDEAKKPKLEVVPEAEKVSIPKPRTFNLDRFKAASDPRDANVETLPAALPVCNIAQAKDFVRLHPDEDNYWSDPLCFVNVPIQGTKRDTVHIIDRVIAERRLDSKKILRFRLALATKPYDIFFLCQVPCTNLDNSWNDSSLRACRQSQGLWTQASSRKEQGLENYKIEAAQDANAFPDPAWPKQSLNELIGITFAGRAIDCEDHPALCRLIGAKPAMS
jgi:hypothetical protein